MRCLVGSTSTQPARIPPFASKNRSYDFQQIGIQAVEVTICSLWNGGIAGVEGDLAEGGGFEVMSEVEGHIPLLIETKTITRALTHLTTLARLERVVHPFLELPMAAGRHGAFPVSSLQHTRAVVYATEFSTA